MASVYDALNAIYAKYTTTKDIGTAFERAALYYLSNAPEWTNLVEDVRLWSECELRDGRDNGIDLVAKDRGDGTYWAIQCKCYAGSAGRAGTAELRNCGTAELRNCGTAELRNCGTAELRNCGTAELRNCGKFADL
ncbi:restriction endonuclease [bacterium]|nr:restriction endonuclease [bacterium]